MAHANDDGHSHDMRSASRRSLWIALGLVGSFMFVEIIGGLMANSLSLLADAAHMVTDVAALGLALFAMWIGDRMRRFGGFEIRPQRSPRIPKRRDSPIFE